MYPDWAVFVLVEAVIVFWLIILTFLVWKQNKFLISLFPKSGSRDIRKKFEEIIEIIEGFKGELSDLKVQIEKIRDQGLQHIQRVELLRYNPYDDTGGDQSFTICLLDSFGTGMVITSLHARPGTRVFGKEIVLGKSSKYQLSKEEELVIKKAMTEQ
ncbi:DUF4446 family protein [Candidatus Daviesbacteria bacterium]|nr:DUF4446 family protein [Candidatus Daviesbacteria bacterium]